MSGNLIKKPKRYPSVPSLLKHVIVGRDVSQLKQALAVDSVWHVCAKPWGQSTALPLLDLPCSAESARIRVVLAVYDNNNLRLLQYFGENSCLEMGAP